MVAVIPAKSEAEVNIIFAQHGIKPCDGAMAMTAQENGNSVGSVVFSLVGTDLTLLSVHYPEKDMFLCDLISRAAMNYGVNRGAMYCKLGNKAPKNEFLTLGFINNTDETELDIIKIFTMCTNCKKNS